MQIITTAQIRKKITKSRIQMTGWDTPIAKDILYASQITREQESPSTTLEKALLYVTVQVADILLRQDAIFFYQKHETY